jgi:hypothetical protein
LEPLRCEFEFQLGGLLKSDNRKHGLEPFDGVTLSVLAFPLKFFYDSPFFYAFITTFGIS